MNLLVALALGLLQGLTEFLPVSSSGHLRLLGAALGIDNPQTLFDVCVHGGTLGAVMAYYRAEVKTLLLGLLRPKWENDGFRMSMLVVIGTIPAAIIGIVFGDWLESRFSSVLVVGCLLIVNGFILLFSRNKGAAGRDLNAMTVRDALIIGVAQALAIGRGISRSGITITTALSLGVERKAAATFSFLLSMPVIAGALVLKLGEALNTGQVDLAPLAGGTLMAALSGYLALVFLIKVVNAGHLHHFAWYCWAIGGIAIVTAIG